jgi:hypothetical protein
LLSHPQIYPRIETNHNNNKNQSSRIEVNAQTSVSKVQKVSSLLESVDNGSVSSLLLEATVEEEGAVAASPRLAVGNTPLGDTNTVLGLDTGVDNLDVAGGIGTGKIKLGHCALGGSSADGLESSRNVVRVVEGAGLAEMGLGTNTVDGDAGGDPLLNVRDETGGLGVGGRVEVVVVDVELGVGVGSASGLKGNTDVVLTEDLHEDVVAESAVLVEGLVNDIPSVDLALEVGHDLSDVVLHDVREGGLVVDVLDPLGKLGVPNQSVATDELTILAGKVDEVVATSEVKLALGGLSGIPLHAVLGGNLTKVGLDDGSGLSVTKSTLVSSSTEVLLALGLEELVQAVGGLGRAGLVAGGDRGLGRGSSAGLDNTGSSGSCDRSGRTRAGTGNALGVVGVGNGTVVASNAGRGAAEALATALSVGIGSLYVSRASRGQRCRKDNGGEGGGRDIHLGSVCVCVVKRRRKVLANDFVAGMQSRIKNL